MRGGRFWCPPFFVPTLATLATYATYATYDAVILG